MPAHPAPLAVEVDELRDTCLLADPAQLELIRDDVPGRDAGTAVAVARIEGRRGRPLGATNKRNAKFRDQILSLCGGQHPGLALARAATTPVETLAAQLGCSLVEAAALAIRAAAEIMPYLESKMPVDVNLTRRSDVVILMPGGGMSADQVEAMREEINTVEADWSSAEIEDLPPSFLGEPMQAVSPPTGGESAA